MVHLANRVTMMSMQFIQKCPRMWTTQLNKMFICPFATTSVLPGKNKYSVPIRDYMLECERLRNQIAEKKRRMRIIESEKQDIFFENRNPRHMELSGFNKPTGFVTLYEKRNFFNKLHLEITNRHTKAYVENIHGQIICYASTTEMAIAKRLHSVTDVSAAVNVARVLAERLKKVGLHRVQFNVRYPRTTEKVREFEGTLRNNDIILAELPRKILLGRPASLPPKREKRIIHSLKLSRRAKNIDTEPKKRMKTRF